MESGGPTLDASKFFPMIPLAEVLNILARCTEMDNIALMREFRAWVRERMAQSKIAAAR